MVSATGRGVCALGSALDCTDAAVARAHPPSVAHSKIFLELRRRDRHSYILNQSGTAENYAVDWNALATSLDRAAV